MPAWVLLVIMMGVACGYCTWILLRLLVLKRRPGAVTAYLKESMPMLGAISVLLVIMMVLVLLWLLIKLLQGGQFDPAVYFPGALLWLIFPLGQMVIAGGWFYYLFKPKPEENVPRLSERFYKRWFVLYLVFAYVPLLWLLWSLAFNAGELLSQF